MWIPSFEMHLSFPSFKNILSLNTGGAVSTTVVVVGLGGGVATLGTGFWTGSTVSFDTYNKKILNYLFIFKLNKLH